MRGAALTGGAFVLAQALRFGSNLILARLLFPDAFGLMALVTMVMVGLTMLSDAGIQQSILHHKRGEEPDFLNTAFTLNAARGLLLWLIACALGWPLAQFYSAPELVYFLPLCGLILLFNGLTPTRVYSAERNILLGRILTIDLIAQVAGIVLMIVLAYLLRSPWALAIGVMATGLIRTLLEWTLIAGITNRFRWERDAGRDLMNFGGWIMLSSAFGFLLAQGDRAILGRFLSMEALGLYNIAYFLAAFPILLLQALMERMLIPAYRETMADPDPNAARRLRRLRRGLSAAVIGLLALAAGIGPWLVGLLYDDRYQLAGPTLVMIACALMPQVIAATYDLAALARGDSKRFFRVTAYRATAQTGLFLLGFQIAGLPGALAGQALAALCVYPAQVWLARHHGVWDKTHDVVFATLAGLLIAGALSLHYPALGVLLP
jgi:O-antigen/teichoic acid export membrane protein